MNQETSESRSLVRQMTRGRRVSKLEEIVSVCTKLKSLVKSLQDVKQIPGSANLRWKMVQFQIDSLGKNYD